MAKSGTLYYKSSEALKFGVWKQHMFTYQVYAVDDTGASIAN